MSKRVAFVGFGSVLDTDIQRVADALGIDGSSLGFFNTINDGAQFVVTKIDGKIVAIEGSEVYISADADDDTISKARRIRSTGVAVNLDWEPFKGGQSDLSLGSWVADGEWTDEAVSAPAAQSVPAVAEEVIPTFIDETPEPEYVAPEPVFDDKFQTQPYVEETAYVEETSYAPASTFEGVASIPASDYAEQTSEYAPESVFSETNAYEQPVEESQYAPPVEVQQDYAPQYAEPEYVPEPQYAPVDTQYAAPDFEAPAFEAHVEQNYAPPVFEEATIAPVSEEPNFLEDAQEQAPQPAPMLGFLNVGTPAEEPQQEYAPPAEYEAPYEQYSVPEQQEYAEPSYEQGAAPQYEAPTYAPEPQYAPPQYEAPAEQQYAAPEQYEQQPQFEVPVEQYAAPEQYPAPDYSAPPVQEEQYGGYTPPTPAASFIQESPLGVAEVNSYQRERSMFEEVPAGTSQDFESKEGGKIVYITGSHGGAGKTTTAWTLASLVAVSMKKAGNTDVSVWLIESDYRNSKLAQRHNIDPARTSGHLASMLEWLNNDSSGMIDNLPQRKAQAIANSTHRLDNGLNIIACPYDTTKRDTKYIQQAVYQAAQYAKMQGGIVFIDADTISNDDIMDSKLAKAADRVVIVSDAGDEHIDDLKRAARILTTPITDGGLGVKMPKISVLLNKTDSETFTHVEESGILAPLALGGYLPFIPEWATGWVGALTNGQNFQNAVVLFARFFNGIVPLKELHQWSNYRASGTAKKTGGSWLKRIFSSNKAK